MEENLQSVRSYKKTPAITVPETPDFLQRLLPAASSSSHPSSPNDIRGPSSTMLGSPFNGPGWLDGSSSQPRLRQSPQSDSQKLALKFAKMEALLGDWGFDSVGGLLQTDSVGKPGSRVAVRPRMEIDEGKRPRKKVPMSLNAGRKDRPQELIR